MHELFFSFQEHLLLCMLMEHSPQMRGTQTPPTVDAVYIDRARALIMDLGSGDLLTQCEERSAYTAAFLYNAAALYVERCSCISLHTMQLHFSTYSQYLQAAAAFLYIL